jgi:hypothetical protein
MTLTDGLSLGNMINMPTIDITRLCYAGSAATFAMVMMMKPALPEAKARFGCESSCWMINITN